MCACCLGFGGTSLTACLLTGLKDMCLKSSPSVDNALESDG